MSDSNGGRHDLDVDLDFSMKSMIDETTTGRDFLRVVDAVLKLVEDPGYSSDSRFVPLPALIDNLQSFLGDMLNNPRHYGFDGGPLETNWNWIGRWLMTSTRALREASSRNGETADLTEIFGIMERTDDSRILARQIEQLSEAARHDVALGDMTQVPLLNQMRSHLQNALDGKNPDNLSQPDEDGMDWMWLAEWIHNAALKN